MSVIISQITSYKLSLHIYKCYNNLVKLLISSKNIMTCNGHGKCGLAKLAWVLVIIGGLNWGLVGLGMLMGSDWNVVGMLLGAWPTLLAIVYLLVGLGTLLVLFGCPCRKCKDARNNCNCFKKEGDKAMPTQA